MKIAKVTNWVQVNDGEYKGMKGQVLAVRENSVIIEFYPERILDERVRTVVNHKRYSILK